MSHKGALKELKKYVQHTFGDRAYFCFVFGSYPLEIAKHNSDLDFLIVADRINPGELEELATFSLGLLKRHGLRLDNNPSHDISYRRKLLVTTNFLKRAIEGGGFLKGPDGRLHARKIIEKPGYLNSNEFLMRLVYNAITSKGKLLCGDQKAYEHYRNEGWKRLIGHVGLIHGHSKVPIAKFVEQMIKKRNTEGEDFLGYKRSPNNLKYLAKKVRRYREKRRK